jgi:hypothetical protein
MDYMHAEVAGQKRDMALPFDCAMASRSIINGEVRLERELRI